MKYLFFTLTFFISFQINADHYFFHENTIKDVPWWGWIIIVLVIIGSIGAFIEWLNDEADDKTVSLIIWIPYFLLGAGVTYYVYNNYGGFEAFVTAILFVILFVLLKIFGKLRN